MKNILLICLILVLSISCTKRKNKLNSNEQKLAADINIEEQKKLDLEEALKQKFVEIPDTVPPGFRFQEDRSIDTQFPPKIIDIANRFNNEKDYKLSELINEIEYIPMEDIPESSYYKSGGYTTTLANNHILVKTMYSLYVFNRDGTFKDVVCESTGDRVETMKKNAAKGVTVASSSGYVKGVWGNVWSIDNKLFYRYADNKAKKFVLMSYDMDSPQNNIPLPANTERFQITGKGEIHASLGVNREERFTEYIPLSKDSYAGINSKTKSAKNGFLMTSFRLNGDTLSSFSDFETINNYKHSVMRSNFPQFIYQYGNTVTFRNAFNDTVYRVIPPNRYFPAYILKMGEYKIETQEGFTPGQDISSKLYIKDFLETKTHIYLKLIQGYDSPNNRKKKSINIFYSIYDKDKKQLISLPINPKGYYGIQYGKTTLYKRRGVINDIDGGFLFWPKKISPKGEPYETITGEILKKHILSERFIHSTAPTNKKEELKKLSKTVRDNQLILVVYK